MSKKHCQPQPVDVRGKFDAENARFPFSIVWTPLPGISWFLPFIGHTGICDAQGVIYDFAGPYFISRDDFAFGSCHKYVPLDIKEDDIGRFHEALIKGNKTYEKRMHNICCDNCHSHVAKVLNNFQYGGHESHTMITVWWMTITQSKYIDLCSVLLTYIGALVVFMIYLATRGVMTL